MFQSELPHSHRSQTRRDQFAVVRVNFDQINQRQIAAERSGLRGADNSAHDFCVSRFGNVADEQNFLGSERFAKLGGERVF